MKLIPSEKLFEILSSKTLLLDTSFFGDYIHYPQEFGDFLNKLKSNGTAIVTTKGVSAEFTKGAHCEEDLETRWELVEQIIDTWIQETAFTKTQILEKTLKHYSARMKNSNKISYVDYLLGCALLTWPGKLFLLSQNFRDFPFEIKAHITLYKRNVIESYAIY